MTRFMGIRFLQVCLFLGILCLHAVGGGVKAFNYRGAGQGAVTFDHGMHASRGYTCADCHTRLPATGKQLFQTQKQGLISMADHTSAQKCFACHDDTVAFRNCDQCHRK